MTFWKLSKSVFFLNSRQLQLNFSNLGCFLTLPIETSNLYQKFYFLLLSFKLTKIFICANNKNIAFLRILLFVYTLFSKIWILSYFIGKNLQEWIWQQFTATLNFSEQVLENSAPYCLKVLHNWRQAKVLV